MKGFVDQHHVEQIRKRLWCGREYGQAVVMVALVETRGRQLVMCKTFRFGTILQN